MTDYYIIDILSSKDGSSAHEKKMCALFEKKEAQPVSRQDQRRARFEVLALSADNAHRCATVPGEEQVKAKRDDRRIQKKASKAGRRLPKKVTYSPQESAIGSNKSLQAAAPGECSEILRRIMCLLWRRQPSIPDNRPRCRRWMSASSANRVRSGHFLQVAERQQLARRLPDIMLQLQHCEAPARQMPAPRQGET